jgi:hypothetical protein
MSATPEPETFLSGESGLVVGPRRRVVRTAGDAVLDVLWRVSGTARRLDRLAASQAPLRVLVVSVYRPRSRLVDALPALDSGSHSVELALGSIGAAEQELRGATVAEGLGGGKFENLNRVLRETPQPDSFDWTVVVDDDVELPDRFLDRFLALCERFRLDLAQPAQTLKSHAAWRVTRRRPGSLVRETSFVEIGPVTAFGRAAAAALMPFPELRYGWGLDLHWAALARERGWRLGVADAVPIRHDATAIASSYSREQAVEEAGRFLTGRPYLPSAEARETVATHRRIPG